jgi:hypothetical protein
MKRWTQWRTGNVRYQLVIRCQFGNWLMATSTLFCGQRATGVVGGNTSVLRIPGDKSRY